MIVEEPVYLFRRRMGVPYSLFGSCITVQGFAS
jgi:hypothetical protein